MYFWVARLIRNEPRRLTRVTASQSSVVSLNSRLSRPVAFVALRPGRDATPDDLIEKCRQPLARYKVPREVYIEEALLKNALGKIAKPVLRERLRRR
jgi:acyl-CoA synthetase (AMP-forming)/AMP-acid ligase II